MFSNRARLTAGLSALLLSGSVLLAGPAAAAPHPAGAIPQSAAAPHPAAASQPSVAAQRAAPVAAQQAAGWLTEQFTAGTHLQTPFSGTYYDDQGLTADGILALDSAGVGQSFAATATNWLAAHVNDYVGDGGSSSYAGSLAKTSLVAMSRGLNPRSFGGRDLIAALTARESAAGRFSDKSSFGDYSNAITQSLAILTERRATGIEPTANAITSLTSLKCADNGYRLYYPTATTPTCVSDPDATAYAIQALRGSSADQSLVTNALTYLAASQKADGGVPNSSGVENSNTTGLAAVTLAVGGNTSAAAKAYGYLAARQQTAVAAGTGNGAVNFSAGTYDPTTSLRATTQAIPGLVAGGPSGTAADAGLLTVHAHGTSAAPTTATASGTFRAVSPARLLDTRQGQPVAAGQSVTVKVTGRVGIPTGISAAAVNITAVTPKGPGYVLAYASGSPRPQPASNLNLVPGVTVAATVLVKVGSDGGIVLSNTSSAALNLLLDVSGYYLPGTGLAAGSYRTVTPTRLLDTRNTGAIPAGRAVSVQLAGNFTANIPSEDVSAVAVTVTAVGAGSGGYVTAYPAGSAPPIASTLNLVTGQTIANAAIVRVGVDGKISLVNVSSKPLNLLLDVSGYFIGGAAQFSGAFVALAPARVLDTRTGSPVAAHTARAVPIGGRLGIPVGAAAVAYNLTAVLPTAAGNVIGYPTGAARPITSAINMTTGRTIANLSITGLSPAGSLTLFDDSPRPVNLLVDVAGYFRA